jgi:hypothetical protein
VSNFQDGPSSSRFSPLAFDGNATLESLKETTGISDRMIAAVEEAPRGACVSWGVPFEIRDVVLIRERPVSISLDPVRIQWLVFMHACDPPPMSVGPGGFSTPMRGEGQLGVQLANYVIAYSDGTQETIPIRGRFQIGLFQRRWGENCFEAVAHARPRPLPAAHEQAGIQWGLSQMRATAADGGPWVNWLWAWENPHPEKVISRISFEPVSGTVVVFGLAGGNVSSHPLRWGERRKVVVTLPQDEPFLASLDAVGQLEQIQLDLGQIISAVPQPVYPDAEWHQSYNNQPPAASSQELLVEYTAHPDACFHLSSGQVVPVAEIPEVQSETPIRVVAPAWRRVVLKVRERASGRVVPVKLHVHGTAGEYLAPVDRHRIPNPAWFEDYSTDFTHQRTHYCTYIPGQTAIKLPLGDVFVEVSKGFEIRPVRKRVSVTPATEEIVVEIEKVLPWRERGWVTADTHVHFLSPGTALLEGAAEGVNVVNLLASQWGELMTNVGDFDGATTWGSREAGGSGEYLVRVGTENRQHVLGHISLLGYRGEIITPLTTGGPDESALGDPIEILLTEWARQCRRQGGLVILPHFPDPRAEHAASIISGDVDGIEMTSWGNLYGGINPYSLSDWYRYLNCGYLVPAVGGTDKMSADTAVGTVRTYTRIGDGTLFTYDTWKQAIKQGETFVTYGPLLEFNVDGHPMGSRIEMGPDGGTVDVSWQVASVTIPMSRVELIVNGEVRESLPVPAWEASGNWSVSVDKSCWLALLVRGHYADRPEIVAAHSSPVMILVERSPIIAAADAVTILEQIEGAMVYLDVLGTRAEERAYKRMRLVLESAHRSLHNRMHRMGFFHGHTPATDHGEHH